MRPTRESETVSGLSEPAVQDRPIGQILGESRNLSPEQIEQVLAYQKQTRLRFGEAAVALRLASDDDVLFALARQFHYPYAPVDKQRLNPELVTAVAPFSRQAEAFRAIRGQLLQRAFVADAPRCALAVISPNPGDGKTFFTANLAVVLSQLGGRTLLIDADMRGPRQHEVFGLENSLGLSGLLSGRAGHNVIRPVPDLPSLFLLAGGAVPPNPIELIERPAFSIVLRELMGKFDYVLVDTPAAWHGADATAIATKCGAALCLARRGHSRTADLQDLMATLSAGSVRLAGAIMNEF